jgi:RelA/SpoT family (p)ppGpp synthetase
MIGFDDISVGAALIHDVVEDTQYSLDLVREWFGPTMETVVDGLTKIREIFANHELGQAENLRKLMLSMASDIRVILVKFADRLHNMRTIDSLSRKKQLKIASETLDLFTPLAHRFGLFALKSELEDLSMAVLYPDEYKSIVRGLRESREERESFIQSFIEPVRERLKRDGFDFEIYGRSKNAFSILQKMKKQGLTLDEVYDVFAIRIVLQSQERKGKEDCWRVYSVITDLYKPLPERFRDFVSVPKSNGYQSLHTTVLGPQGKRVEVQIRTQQMHQVAERGIAAHWRYKEGVAQSDGKMDDFLAWVRDLLENPRPEAATEFVKEFRLNLYHEEIYLFTPRGDLLTLPHNATPVDFAFQVHSEIGFHCIGAKVNGRMVPLSHRLTSGDQVEIITSKKQTPNPDWANFVVTHKARSRVRAWVNEKRRKAIELGQEAWQKRAKRSRIQADDAQLQRAARALKFSNTQQMFYEIGTGLLDPADLVKTLKEGVAAPESSDVKWEEHFEHFLQSAHETGRPGLLIDGELHTDISTRYAPCCNPIPGDDVFGFVSKSGSISIHRFSCRNATHLLSTFPDRIVQVEWSRQKDVQFVTALRIIGEDRVGMISDITTVISKSLKTNIRSITVDTDDGIFEGTIVLFVSDLDHLHRLISRVKRVAGVHGVFRFEQAGEEISNRDAGP